MYFIIIGSDSTIKMVSVPTNAIYEITKMRTQESSAHHNANMYLFRCNEYEFNHLHFQRGDTSDGGGRFIPVHACVCVCVPSAYTVVGAQYAYYNLFI